MKQHGIHGHIESSAHHRQLFTKEMRADNYTILVPNMSPIHFDLLIPLFAMKPELRTAA